jgi:hypothetical protein
MKKCFLYFKKDNSLFSKVEEKLDSNLHSSAEEIEPNTNIKEDESYIEDIYSNPNEKHLVTEKKQIQNPNQDTGFGYYAKIA